MIAAAISKGASHMILPTALLANLLPPADLRFPQGHRFWRRGVPEQPGGALGRAGGAIQHVRPDRVHRHRALRAAHSGAPITIGSPVNNLKALILDEAGNLCPVGSQASSAWQGLGLACGYLNLPERTQEAFIELALAEDRTHRLYRTGDRALLRRDGNIQYLGRIDEQIKLRGYRIEPGEIETRLAELCPVIRQIKVVVQEGRLLAYACLQAGARSPTATPCCSEPASACPNTWCRRASAGCPRCRSPQRQAGLAPPACHRLAAEQGRAAKRTGADRARHLARVLKQPLGVEDDFFRLGGDSILSIQLTTRLRDAGLHCSVKDVFEAKTVRRLCRQLGQQQAVSHRSEQGSLTGEFPAPPHSALVLRAGLCQVRSLEPGVILRLPAGVDDEALRGWLNALRQHHDALRLAVTPTGQRYLAELPLPPLPTLDAANLDEAGLQARLTELQGELDPCHRPHPGLGPPAQSLWKVRGRGRDGGEGSSSPSITW